MLGLMEHVGIDGAILYVVTAPILCIRIHNYTRFASGFHQIPQKNSSNKIFGIPKEFHESAMWAGKTSEVTSQASEPSSIPLCESLIEVSHNMNLYIN